MSLLLGNIDTNTVQLIGRWCSDEMMRYLHVTVQPLIQGNAATMVATEDYTLIPAKTFQT